MPESTARVHAAGGVAAMAVLALASGARAHPETSPLFTNRYLTITALEEHAGVSFVMLLGQLPAGEARLRMDLDGDGTLSASEVEAAEARLLTDQAALFAVTVDGQTPSARWRAAIDLGPDGRTGAAPLMMEIGSFLPLSRQRHALVVTPGEDPPRAGETEISIDLAPGWKLTGPREARKKFHGPRRTETEDRSVTFVIAPGPIADPDAEEVAMPPSRPDRHVMVAVAALAALGLAVASLTIWRRRRRAPDGAPQPGRDARM